MSYSLRFEGRIAIDPPLDTSDLSALSTFCGEGAPAAPVEADGFVLLRGARHHCSISAPEAGAPPGPCCWRPTPDGTALEWDGCDTFQRYEAWTKFLRDHFFTPRARTLHGRVRWEGEDGATGSLVVDSATGRIADEPDAVGSIDDEVRSWLSTLEKADDEMKLVAVRELASAVSASTVARRETAAALCRSLEDPLLVKAALETLGELGPIAEAAVEPATRLLESGDAQVRYWATYALGRLGPAAKFAIPQLERLTSDAEYGPRYGAIEALARLTRA